MSLSCKCAGMWAHAQTWIPSKNLIKFPINYRYHAFLTFSSPSWRFQPPGKLLAWRLKRNSNYFLHLKEWKWHIKHNSQCTLSLVFAHFCFTHDHTVLCRHNGTSLFPRFNVLYIPPGQIQHDLRWKLRYSPVIFFKNLSLVLTVCNNEGNIILCSVIMWLIRPHSLRSDAQRIFTYPATQSLLSRLSFAFCFLVFTLFCLWPTSKHGCS